MNLQIRVPGKRYSRGMTLVEVLIAAVVIAVGLLGVASLQINALQSTTEAQNRSKAIDIIAALADRVWANPAPGGIAAYNNAIPVDPCTVAPDQPLPIIERCAMSPDGDINAVSECTPAEMAAYDLWEVNCELQSIIPGAILNISCPAPDCAQMVPITVNISWQAQNRNPEVGVTAPQNTITRAIGSTILPGVSQ
ncbi:MAG: type IV pilus modification protein PilV [gamma proteobacterium symbiont of Ctena orbiculata]|nr:type IV pilus modification protein PilV [Candidatus Thiodiazotropha taylori]PUB83418.1 MAG: type IV pilus modification protein PilV [gamma proteobacterium symbiont of Ctena orbiculata]MBT2998765.1 type IV pilus modification protein PilV [Candidatus Thiodiazotropha taylori]MBT2999573.1 type IV pilus modification protein PilV [Candidatus Thiodiazotropha taylori]MBT3026635.1 type IV pilus modification protein PilV [Candidatus Thiodiazotropha taylori]